MEVGDDSASEPVSPGTKRALCLYCRAVHRVALSCPCFRCGFRHEGDCATVCKFCDRSHPPTIGCSKRPRSYFTAAHRSKALFEHSIDNNNVHQHVVQHYLGVMDVVCSHCRARTWFGEKLNCCHSGSIVFPVSGVVSPDFSKLIVSFHVRHSILSVLSA